METHKFLGLTFDSKLTWNSHIKELKKKCLRQMNLLKVVANRNQGVRRKLLLKLLSHGCTIYGSAKNKQLKTLDDIQNTSLRICIGAYHTCPTYSIYGDSGEVPLLYKRNELMLKYFAKIRSLHTHPIKNLINNSHKHLCYAAFPKSPKPLIIRISILINMTYNLTGINTIDREISNTPPWNNQTVSQIQELIKHQKDQTPAEVYKALFLNFMSQNSDTEFIFTDSSMKEKEVGCAYIWKDQTVKIKLSTHCSSFTAELIAIEKAIDQCRNIPSSKIIICTDSRSSIDNLTTIKTSEYCPKLSNLIYNMRKKLDHLLKRTN